MKLNILLIEDQKAIHDMLKITTPQDKVEIISAFNMAEALAAIEQGKDAKYILLDGGIGNPREDGKPETITLVPLLKEKFPQATIMAISANLDHNDILVETGCHLSSPKEDFLIPLLNLLAEKEGIRC
jgi:CheY-like chemotaxis protein